MQRLIAFLLSWTLLKTGPFPSKSQLNYLLLILKASALATQLYDPLHIAAFCTDQTPSHLKFLVIIYLNIKAACILYIIVIFR
jgi:hypothetical protein